MSALRFGILCSFLFLTNTSHSQDTDSLFRRLSDLHTEKIRHLDDSLREVIRREYDSTLYRLIRDQEICSAGYPDSLRYHNAEKIDTLDGATLAYTMMNVMVVARSEDSELTVYSADNIDGGNWHSYKCFLTFSNKSECYSKLLDTSEVTFEVGYYRVHRLPIKGKKVYLLLGYGTYGSGKHHYLARTIEVKNSEIIPYPAFGTEELMIGANRPSNVDLKYDPTKQTLSYNYYEFDNEIEFFKIEAIPKELRFKKGLFR